ncbi:hypothetical protein SLOPH_1810 [Spraguea lophii 42_110]|uniref:Uncharacterized protein n=1 Tax=Spraguea lophii (strain 42_110) TaxID=1358809 RepID=S7XU55_SPRLO|nr:hypothetical protein SLOPH_1810 [Spraguea lophii 42_110]
MKNLFAPTTYISRKNILKELKITSDEFKMLCVITNTRQIKGQDKFYVKDINKLYRTDAYYKLQKEKRKYKKFNRDYLQMIKDKYPKLELAVEGIPESITVLSIIKILLNKESKFSSIKTEIKKRIETVLNDFKNFVEQYKLLDSVFLSDIGFYYKIKMNNISFIWYEPVDVEEYEFDNILLENYIINLFHMEMIMKKIAIEFKDYNIEHHDKNNIFNNIGCRIDIMKDHFEFIYKCGGGTIGEDIIITDGNVEIEKDKIYIHPQYLLDSFNERNMKNKEEYLIGSTLPPHKSPFIDDKLHIGEDDICLLSARKKDIIEKYLQKNEVK